MFINKKTIIFSITLLTTTSALLTVDGSKWMHQQNYWSSATPKKSFTSAINTHSKYSSQLQHNRIKNQINLNSILSKITQTHLLVPANTDPNLQTSATIETIKQKLGTNNPQLTNEELNTIRISALLPHEKLTDQHYNTLIVAIKTTSSWSTKFIYVKLALNFGVAINLYTPLLYSSVGVRNPQRINHCYRDDIFLKSLAYDEHQQQLISTIQPLHDPSDRKEYHQMQNIGTLKMKNSLVLLNRYLANGLLQYNPHGYLPTKNNLMQVKIPKQQSIITLASKWNQNFRISDYLTIDLHWDRVSITLKPRLMNKIFLHLINIAILRILGATTIFRLAFRVFINRVKIIINNMLEALGIEASLVVDEAAAEIPGVGEIIMAVATTIILIIVDHIINEILIILKKIYYSSDFAPKLLRKIITTGKFGHHAIDENQHYLYVVPDVNGESLLDFSLTIDIPFFLPLFFAGIHLNVELNPSIIAWNTITPSQFDSSLGVGSSITGDGNDLTIMVSYSYLDQLRKSLWDHNDKDDLFLHCSWKNIGQFKELNVEALSTWFDNTYQKMEWGWVDPGHMTVIHLKKINGEYQAVWTNLDSKKGSNSLAMTWGSLSSLIIKINGEMHWWVSKNLLVNIYDTLRYFQKAKVFLDKNNALNLQCTSQYNLKQTQIFNIIVDMDQAELYKQINKNYFAYDLVFEGKKSNWTWQNTSELLLNHNNN